MDLFYLFLFFCNRWAALQDWYPKRVYILSGMQYTERWSWEDSLFFWVQAQFLIFRLSTNLCASYKKFNTIIILFIVAAKIRSQLFLPTKTQIPFLLVSLSFEIFLI